MDSLSLRERERSGRATLVGPFFASGRAPHAPEPLARERERERSEQQRALKASLISRALSLALLLSSLRLVRSPFKRRATLTSSPPLSQGLEPWSGLDVSRVPSRPCGLVRSPLNVEPVFTGAALLFARVSARRHRQPQEPCVRFAEGRRESRTGNARRSGVYAI